MFSQLASVLIIALGVESGAGATETPAPAREASQFRSDVNAKVKGRMLPKEQRAPVAYESPNGGLFFRANIAGREVWAMLDTGATYSLMDIELARSAGLSIGTPEKSVETPSGEVTMQLVSDVPILIPGQFQVHYPRLAGVDLTPVSNDAGREIDFILGQEFLRPLVIIVDPTKRMFFLAPSGSFRAPRGAIEVDLQSETEPQIELTIHNEKALVTLGTGLYDQLALAPAAWARILPDGVSVGADKTSANDAEGQPVAKRSAMLPEVQIGSLRLTNVQVTKSSIPGEVDGILGMGILGKFRFALDISKAKLWLGAASAANAGRAKSRN